MTYSSVFPFFKKFGLIIVLIIIFLLFGYFDKNSNSTHATDTEKYTKKYTEEVVVAQVFDGDTFSAKINGVTEKIRILGIDTPEVSGGYKDAECFGENASVFTKKKLTGKIVTLYESKIGDKTDKYGRFLRYVEFEKKDFGELLILEGYAQSYKKFPHDRKLEYNQSEKNAKDQKKGLWGKCF